jgi:hypothetical protein
MSLVDVKVELGFNFAGPGVGAFQFDSDTNGVLGVSALSDLVFYDVSSYVMNVSTNRGRSRQLDYFNAGSATVVLDNRSREFDPLNESSTFYPNVKPRGLIRISASGVTIFYGYINDWDLSYDISNNDVATVYCSDAFSILSNQVLSAFTPAAQLSGARVNTVLSRTEVDFIGGRDVDAGTLTLGAYAVAQDTNVLNYLRQIERSEFGSLFVSADGDIVFRQRNSVSTSALVLFSDANDGIPYQTLSNEFGDELLFNYVRLKSPAGVEQVKSDPASIGAYQVSQLSYQDLLNNSTGVLANLASSYLGRFKEPRVRLTGFNVQMLALSAEQKTDVLLLDLADYVNLKKSFAVGSPSSLTQFSQIAGVSHSISPDSHRVGFTVEAAEGSLYLTLGNSIAGRLDFNLLDF